ncbi:Nif3-like dinuclear metal center hexameric protein [Salirhabdus sp. Marseille-P4669]|uniref:Nif3-like dinuclear metal center hexameric protein n=1 Tax=Salirhabdus sp. Marseille-P4669 TaxID=2042310 RepID=UPI000C7A359B|nr:Nif3-like dinuclear metal center hexameric protein [Salirhabdus sp. Marseille-P4669]
MSKTVTGQQVIRVFEEWAPKTLAMEGDNVGLQVGTLNRPVRKIMVTLDVLENVIDEAIEKQVNLIIAHHPFLYKSLSQIDTNQEKGRIIKKLIQHDITVYAAHTNLDLANGGVNDMLIEALGLESDGAVMELGNEPLFKLVVFVPESHEEQVRNALGENGAGHIGNYSHCTFQTPGIGTFKPMEGTNPYIGSQGELEKVKEVRMETIVPKSKLSIVLKAMEKAHPYEEVAYDLYPVELKGQSYGLGRVATLKNPATLKQFAEHVKKALDVPSLRVVGDLNKEIKKVGVIGGNGNKYIHKVKRSGCDVLITGDLYFHTAHDALGIGLNVIDPGHHVEKVMKRGVKDYLDKKCLEQGLEVEIIISEANTEPFTFI